ncbi:UDP-N-acetylglucosamine--dolichyl-phosphate N-acetylglucosaminephosphotransferase [Babesia sp. Xinjiang]|uniref:UDP-N-acetylglucosamine--dolichyl-phosphate N-acetylglucosaminephosphotransferase n=1 Tax=Babesia sp. Xinjiang TaxID=462227 RepID=UPI000A23F414|nr:UDP-N-acetylglucosamine--dolichyl-phosphate N-acetylglucosaminephosphotransferase [Babesia sp. Xinjiang]ORM40370.1 UDP-N-acetylglucosamine--dolichyl-phosphate N-acetylglucosaminephosphotransferase [Babesia sp. Xinjiang]
MKELHLKNAGCQHIRIQPSLRFEEVTGALLLTPYVLAAVILYPHSDRGALTIASLATCFPLALATYVSIPRLVVALRKKDLCNINLNAEVDAQRVAEPGSLWACALYLLYLIGLSVVCTRGSQTTLFNTIIVNMAVMTLMGLMDDMVPLGYPAKILAPVLAAIPLYVTLHGTARPSVPLLSLIGLRDAYGLGYLGHFLAVLLTVFFVNSINIHAGINGLELGESAVIAVSLLAHNCIEIAKTAAISDSSTATELIEKHLLSVQLTLPFLSISAGLLCYNWYPATTFVGNMYTSLSGALFAATSILCDSSLMMLMLFVPQMVNFVVSIPQLIGIIHCPRFRAPRFNPKTGLLEHTKNYTLLNAALWEVKLYAVQ